MQSLLNDESFSEVYKIIPIKTKYFITNAINNLQLMVNNSNKLSEQQTYDELNAVNSQLRNYMLMKEMCKLENKDVKAFFLKSCQKHRE